LVPDSPERTEDGPWTALEQGFFETAPPDVPEPSPEPVSFDDLLPPVVRRTRAPLRLERVLAAAAATKAALLGVFVGVGPFARLTMTRAAGRSATIVAASRGRSRLVLKAVCETSVRQVRAVRIGFVAALSRWSQRGFQLAIGSLILVSGFSLGFVVSRRGAAASSEEDSPGLASVADTAVKADGERRAPSSSWVALDPVPPAMTAAIAPRMAAAAPIAAPAPAPTRVARLRRAAEPRHSETANHPAARGRRVAASSARDLIIPSFMERPVPPPVPARRPFFSR
jgi:hypothetical protein